MADRHDADGRGSPAAVGQRLLRMMAHYRSGNGALNCPIVYRLRGPVDAEALSAALAGLTARHESLRTVVASAGSRMTQQVHEPRPVPVSHVDLRAAAGEDAVQRTLLAELRTEIPVGSWPVRATLYRTGQQDYVLCLVIQHYVTDGWSNAILRGELWDLYRQFAGGPAASLPPVGWQYPEFARWQAGRIGQPAWRGHEDYWRQRLDGVRFPELPAMLGDRAADMAGRGDAAGRTGVAEFRVADTSVAALELLAGQERTTLFTAALAVFYLWLHRMTGQSDLAVGSMFANRLRPETIGTVGFFANLVVLRTVVPMAGTFRDVLKATRGTVNEALDHQEVPCQMVRLAPAARGAARAEDLMFQMQPWPLDERRTVAGVDAWQIPPPEGVATRFAFEFFLCPAAAGGLLGMICFAEDRFQRAWVRESAADFEVLAAQLVAAPDQPLAQLAPGIAPGVPS